MPRHKPSERWVPLFDTARRTVDENEVYSVQDTYALEGRSVVLLVLKGGWPDLQAKVHAGHEKSLKLHKKS